MVYAVFVFPDWGVLDVLCWIDGTCLSSAMRRVQSARSGRIVRQEGQE